MTISRLLLFLLAFGFASSAYADGVKAMPKSFKLRGLTGGVVGPGDLEGKVTILQFFAAWCVGCGPVMSQLSPLVEGRSDALFIPVSVDESTNEAIAYFKRQSPRVKPLVKLATHDDKAKLATAMAIEALPAVVVVDGEGHVLASFTGHPDAAFIRKTVKLIGAKP